MNPEPRFVGLREFVEGLAERLQSTPWAKQPQSDQEVCAYLAATARSYLESLFPSDTVPHAVWEEDHGGAVAIEPANFFGPEMRPRLAVDVAGEPTLALEGGIVRQGAGQQGTIAALLGRAIISTRCYPAALAFILYDDQEVPGTDLYDREFLHSLWSELKVRVVLRTAL